LASDTGASLAAADAPLKYAGAPFGQAGARENASGAPLREADWPMPHDSASVVVADGVPTTDGESKKISDFTLFHGPCRFSKNRRQIARPAASSRRGKRENQPGSQLGSLSHRTGKEVILMANKVHADADLATKLIAGLNRHLATVSQLALAGGTFTPAQVTTQLQAIVNTRADVDAAKAQVEAKLAAFDAQAPAQRVFLDAFVSFVKAAFGNAPDVLADFGLKPKKARTPLTVEAKAAAAAKRAATRAKRNVLGKVQRKAVKGNVTGVVVTPIVAPQPATPAPNGPTQPAANGGGTTAPATHTA
jgi:hypothetical protein